MRNTLAALAFVLGGCASQQAVVPEEPRIPVKYDFIETNIDERYRLLGHKEWYVYRKKGSNEFWTALDARNGTLDTIVRANSIEDLLELDAPLQNVLRDAKYKMMFQIEDETGSRNVQAYMSQYQSSCILFLDMNGDGKFNRIIDMMATYDQEKKEIRFIPGMIQAWKQEPIAYEIQLPEQ